MSEIGDENRRQEKEKERERVSGAFTYICDILL